MGENRYFAFAKTKTQISFAVSAKLNSAFVFTTHIVQYIPLLPKTEISSFYASSVIAQPGLCGIWSETLKTDFLKRLISFCLKTIAEPEQTPSSQQCSF